MWFLCSIQRIILLNLGRSLTGALGLITTLGGINCPCLVGVPGPPAPGAVSPPIACCGWPNPDPPGFIAPGLPPCGTLWCENPPPRPPTLLCGGALSLPSGRGLLRPRGSFSAVVDEVGVA